MKKINLNKKLELNKNSIAWLNDDKMNNINGGDEDATKSWFSVCKSCVATNCTCLTDNGHSLCGNSCYCATDL